MPSEVGASKPGNPHRPRRTFRHAPDELIFRVNYRFFDAARGDPSAASVARQYNRDFDDSLSREQVYQIVREAVRRKQILFYPPHHDSLAERLRDALRNRNGARLEIEVIDPADRQPLSMVAARLVLRLLPTCDSHPVHIGLGPGYLVRDTVRFLRPLFRSDSRAPNLTVCPLAPPGHAELAPETSPVGFACYLDIGRNNVILVSVAHSAQLDMGICEALEPDTEAEKLPVAQFQTCQLGRLVAAGQPTVILVGPATGLPALTPLLDLPGPIHLLTDVPTAERLLHEWLEAQDLAHHGELPGRSA